MPAKPRHAPVAFDDAIVARDLRDKPTAPREDDTPA